MRVFWESGEPRKALQPLYPFHRQVPGKQPDRTYRLHGQVGDGTRTWAIFEDNELVTEHCPEDLLAATLERLITARVLARQHGLVLIHAATVVVNGGCVVLPGPSGAGKTTLALALRDQGIQVLGDDILMLDPASLTACAYPRSFLIKDDRRSPRVRLEVYGDVHGEPSAGRAFRVGHIILPERRAAAAAALFPCRGTEALQSLIQLTESRLAGAELTFRALARLVRRARLHRLIYAEASQGAAVLIRMLRAGLDSRLSGRFPA